LAEADTKTPGGGYAPSGKNTGRVKPKGTARIRAHDDLQTIELRARKPGWLKVRSPGGQKYLRLQKLMRSQALHTVCEEAACPNMGECWEAGTATFMILGDVCTRACKYCGVAHGMPTTLDEEEPWRVTEAVSAMALEHVVITSVNRDELPDGGAGIYAETIRRIHDQVPGCSVEVLIPDFKGDEDALRMVVEAKPEILGHNLETVERLHPEVRPGGRYWRSISFLGAAKRMDPSFAFMTAPCCRAHRGRPAAMRTSRLQLRDFSFCLRALLLIRTRFVARSRPARDHRRIQEEVRWPSAASADCRAPRRRV